jgi:hypothetical protein
LTDFFDDLPFFADAVFEEAGAVFAEAAFVEVVFVEAAFAPAFFGSAFFGGEPVVVDCGRASEAINIVSRKSKRPFVMRFSCGFMQKRKGAFHCPLCIVRN